MRPARTRTFAALILAALVLVVPAGCDRGNADVAGPTGRALARLVRPPVSVAVRVATLGPIASYYTTTATLESEKEADVIARVAGVIRKLLVEEGDVVQEGAPLLKLDNDEFLHRLHQAEANRKNLESRYTRLTEMLAQNLVSIEEHDTVSSELSAAKATEELARLSLEYTTVRAPFTGRVTHRFVDIGQKASLDTALFTIADFEPLLARVHVPAGEFRKIQIEQVVDIVLRSNGQSVQGRITLVSPVIDPKTGTIKVTVEIREYPPGTRPGDFVAVSIVTEQRESRTLVDRNAVILDKGDRVVFVVSGGGKEGIAERRIVQVGFEDGDHSEIISGLESGDRVVVKGQRSLKNGSPLKVLEEDWQDRPVSTS